MWGIAGKRNTALAPPAPPGFGVIASLCCYGVIFVFAAMFSYICFHVVRSSCHIPFLLTCLPVCHVYPRTFLQPVMFHHLSQVSPLNPSSLSCHSLQLTVFSVLFWQSRVPGPVRLVLLPLWRHFHFCQLCFPLLSLPSCVFKSSVSLCSLLSHLFTSSCLHGSCFNYSQSRFCYFSLCLCYHLFSCVSSASIKAHYLLDLFCPPCVCLWVHTTTQQVLGCNRNSGRWVVFTKSRGK